MSKHDIVMPQMGESITNGTITKWNKSIGDLVEVDEILLEISTDKVESEIPSPFKGKVTEILFQEGDVVDVGIKIASIDENVHAEVSNRPKETSQTAPLPLQKETAPLIQLSPSIPNSPTGAFFTPLVKAMAKDHQISLSEFSHLKGSGAGNRVNKTDFLHFLETKNTPSKTPSGRVEVIPMDNMRKTIARNMIESKTTAPHVNSISEVDLTHLVKFREAFKQTFFEQEGFKLTFTPFIIKAIVEAIQEFPMLNSSIEGENIILKKDINLGFAVAVPGNGLVVPVIKNADSYNMRGLCRVVHDFAEKARTKKLTLDDLSGGTFTFTNVGSFGTLLATPIILRPQVGIYAAGAINKKVMVMDDDSFAIRSMMYGTHTYDHRLIDGEQGGKFLEAIHRNLRSFDFQKLF